MQAIQLMDDRIEKYVSLLAEAKSQKESIINDLAAMIAQLKQNECNREGYQNFVRKMAKKPENRKLLANWVVELFIFRYTGRSTYLTLETYQEYFDNFFAKYEDYNKAASLVSQFEAAARKAEKAKYNYGNNNWL